MFKYKIILLLLLYFALVEISVMAQEEREIAKIDAIVNLTRFVDWSQNESFNHSGKVLYVITKTNYNKTNHLSNLNNPAYRNWRIVFSDKIINFEKGSVVFLTNDKSNYETEIIRISGDRDILTISDNTADFCKKGGMINIWENNGQIKFEINYRIIQDKSLDISSKLLALSKIYE
jgi:hypothetical protein